MPRRGRVIAPGYPHHIVQRGHNRRSVFFVEDGRLSYLATLCEFCEKLGLQVYAHCLITNHVHLIVNPGSDVTSLSLLMKHLAGRHTRRLNILALATTEQQRQRYREFVRQAIPESEIEFLRTTVSAIKYLVLMPSSRKSND